MTLMVIMMAGGMTQAQSAAPAPAAPAAAAARCQGGSEGGLCPAGGIGPGAVPPRQEPRHARSARAGRRSLLRAALRGAQLAEADGAAHAAARHAGAVSRGQSRVAALHLRQRRPEDLLAEGAPLRRRAAARRHLCQRLPLVARRRAAGVPGASAGRHAGVDRGRPHGQSGSGQRCRRDGDARAARRRRQPERGRARQPDAAVAARRIAADAARAGQSRSRAGRHGRADRPSGAAHARQGDADRHAAVSVEIAARSRAVQVLHDGAARVGRARPRAEGDWRGRDVHVVFGEPGRQVRAARNAARAVLGAGRLQPVRARAGSDRSRWQGARRGQQDAAARVVAAWRGPR